MGSLLSQTYGSQAGIKGYKEFRFKFSLVNNKRIRYITIKARTLSEAVGKFKGKYKGKNQWGQYNIVSIS